MSGNTQYVGRLNNSLRKQGREEVDIRLIRETIGQAEELGVSIVVLAGGEPLLRPAADEPGL